MMIKKACLIFLCVLFSAFILLTGCAQRSGSAAEESNGQNTENNITDNSESSSENDGSSNLAIGQVDPNRKLIYYVYYDMESTKFDSSLSSLLSLTDKLGGYVEKSEVSSQQSYSGYREERTAKYIIRIPSEKLNDFFAEIGTVGRILNEKLESTDVTLEYVDTKARIESLKLREDRVLAILESADNLEYILEIERELSDIRYEIESYTSKLNKMESLISYSRVTVNLDEVFEETTVKKTPVTFGEKLADTFNKSVERIWSGLESFAVWFLGNIVEIVFYLALIAGSVVLIVTLTKRSAKKRANKFASIYQASYTPPQDGEKK